MAATMDVADNNEKICDSICNIPKDLNTTLKIADSDADILNNQLSCCNNVESDESENIVEPVCENSVCHSSKCVSETVKSDSNENNSCNERGLVNEINHESIEHKPVAVKDDLKLFQNQEQMLPQNNDDKDSDVEGELVINEAYENGNSKDSLEMQNNKICATMHEINTTRDNSKVCSTVQKRNTEGVDENCTTIQKTKYVNGNKQISSNVQVTNPEKSVSEKCAMVQETNDIQCDNEINSDVQHANRERNVDQKCIEVPEANNIKDSDEINSNVQGTNTEKKTNEKCTDIPETNNVKDDNDINSNVQNINCEKNVSENCTDMPKTSNVKDGSEINNLQDTKAERKVSENLTKVQETPMFTIDDDDEICNTLEEIDANKCDKEICTTVREKIDKQDSCKENFLLQKKKNKSQPTKAKLNSSSNINPAGAKINLKVNPTTKVQNAASKKSQGECIATKKSQVSKHQSNSISKHYNEKTELILKSMGLIHDNSLHQSKTKNVNEKKFCVQNRKNSSIHVNVKPKHMTRDVAVSNDTMKQSPPKKKKYINVVNTFNSSGNIVSARSSVLKNPVSAGSSALKNPVCSKSCVLKNPITAGSSGLKNPIKHKDATSKAETRILQKSSSPKKKKFNATINCTAPPTNQNYSSINEKTSNEKYSEVIKKKPNSSATQDKHVSSVSAITTTKQALTLKSSVVSAAKEASAAKKSYDCKFTTVNSPSSSTKNNITSVNRKIIVTKSNHSSLLSDKSHVHSVSSHVIRSVVTQKQVICCLPVNPANQNSVNALKRNLNQLNTMFNSSKEHSTFPEVHKSHKKLKTNEAEGKFSSLEQSKNIHKSLFESHTEKPKVVVEKAPFISNNFSDLSALRDDSEDEDTDSEMDCSSTFTNCYSPSETDSLPERKKRFHTNAILNEQHVTDGPDKNADEDTEKEKLSLGKVKNIHDKDTELPKSTSNNQLLSKPQDSRKNETLDPCTANCTPAKRIISDNEDTASASEVNNDFIDSEDEDQGPAQTSSVKKKRKISKDPDYQPHFGESSQSSFSPKKRLRGKKRANLGRENSLELESERDSSESGTKNSADKESSPERQYMPVNRVDMLSVGMKFSSFKEASDAIRLYEKKNFLHFYIRDSCTIERILQRKPTRKLNKKLKYTYVRYVCSLSEKNLKSEAITDQQETKCCPAVIVLGVAMDGETLDITTMNDIHNHKIQGSFESLSKEKNHPREIRKCQDDHFKMKGVDMLSVGMKFSSFEEARDAVRHYEKKNYVQFSIRNSCTVERILQRKPTRKINKKLKYTYVRYTCSFSEKHLESKAITDQQETKCCPAVIVLAVAMDGETLDITTMNDIHNHKIYQGSFESWSEEKNHPREIRKCQDDHFKMKASPELTEKIADQSPAQTTEKERQNLSLKVPDVANVRKDKLCHSYEFDARAIDSGIKNPWRWGWLERQVEGVYVREIIRKLERPGVAYCTICSKEVMYGSRGFGALSQHMKLTKHMSAVEAREQNYAFPALPKATEKVQDKISVEPSSPKHRVSLSDIPCIAEEIQNAPRELLPALHTILFNTYNPMNTKTTEMRARRNILSFSGFFFKEGSSSFETKKSYIKRYHHQILSDIAVILFGSKLPIGTDIADRILHFLMHPTEKDALTLRKKKSRTKDTSAISSESMRDRLLRGIEEDAKAIRDQRHNMGPDFEAREVQKKVLEGPVLKVSLQRLDSKEIEQYTQREDSISKSQAELKKKSKLKDGKCDPEKQPVVIVQYHKKNTEWLGKPLRMLAKVPSNIKEADEKVISLIHVLLFGNDGKVATRREDILDFNGFPPGKKYDYKNRKRFLRLISLTDLIKVCKVLNLRRRSQEKKGIIEGIMTFIKSPYESFPQNPIIPSKKLSPKKPLEDLDEIPLSERTSGSFERTSESLEGTSGSLEKTSGSLEKTSESLERTSENLSPQKPKENSQNSSSVSLQKSRTKIELSENSVAPVNPAKKLSAEKPLGEFEKIRFNVECATPDDLTELYDILFVKPCDGFEIHRKILDFCGFDFSTDSVEFHYRKTLLSYMKFEAVTKIGKFLDLIGEFTHVHKKDLEEKILKFLMEPKTIKIGNSPSKPTHIVRLGKTAETGVPNSLPSNSQVENFSCKSLSDDHSRPYNTPDSCLSLRTMNAEVSSSSDDEFDSCIPLVAFVNHPSDSRLKKDIREIICTSRLHSLTMKNLVTAIYLRYPEFDLRYRSNFIKSRARQILSTMQGALSFSTPS